MPGPARGLYEVLITEALQTQLLNLGDRLLAIRGELWAAEAADRIALHLTRVAERAIAMIDERPRVGIDLSRRLIAAIIQFLLSASSLAGERPTELSEVLRSIAGRFPDRRAETIDEPLTPLLDTTLLNGTSTGNATS